MENGHPHYPTDEVLTVEGFAKRMKVSRSTAYGWIQSGKLVAGVHYFHTPGGKIRFRWSNRVVDRFLLESGSPPTATAESPCPEGTSPTGSRRHRINLSYCGSAVGGYPLLSDGNEPSRKEMTPKGEGDG